MDNLSIILGFVLTAFVSIAGTYLILRFNKSRKQLGYEVMFAQRIAFLDPASDDPLQIVLKGSGAETEDKSVQSVYAFGVRLKNPGDEALEEQSVWLELDNSATVVSVLPTHQNPTWNDRQLTWDQVEPHLVKLLIPLLNTGEVLDIDVRSVENKSATCQIYATSKNLSVVSLEHRRLRNSRFLILVSLILLGSGGVLVFESDPDPFAFTVKLFIPGIILTVFGMFGFSAAMSRLARRRFY